MKPLCHLFRTRQATAAPVIPQEPPTAQEAVAAIDALLSRSGNLAHLSLSERRALQTFAATPHPWRPGRSAREILEENASRNAAMRALLTLGGVDDGFLDLTPQELLVLNDLIAYGARRLQEDIREYLERFGAWPAHGRERLGNFRGTFSEVPSLSH
jgi:hypothetical protein